MQIRPAIPGDEMAVARVHVRSWQVAYRQLLPAGYLEQLRPEDRAQRYDFASLDPSRPQTIVAHEAESILGFVTIMPSSDPTLIGYGELCALYVDPEHWNRGIGVALVSVARTHLVQRGFQNAVLWILAGNIRAERFYQIDGWAPDGARKMDTIWGITVEEIRFRRTLTAPH